MNCDTLSQPTACAALDAETPSIGLAIASLLGPAKRWMMAQRIEISGGQAI